MEFLRFGSSIPGSYWGCCACDIIQNFTVDPDAKASIQIVEGDGGTPYNPNKFAGVTYKDIFEQRLRYGTFSASPERATNHAFIAILAVTQVQSAIGKKWLAILKANGFEFVRTVNNSVWNKDNYIFMLVRNIGSNAVKDQFKPPKEWTDLPDVVLENFHYMNIAGEAVTEQIKVKQKELYAALPPLKFYTEEELDALNVPVTLAGKRSHQWGQFAVGFPQQLRQARVTFQAAFDAMTGKADKPSAFPVKASTPPVAG